MTLHPGRALVALGVAAALLAAVPIAEADGPCAAGPSTCAAPDADDCLGVLTAGVCVALDLGTGCADVAVQLPPPFSQPLPLHACSPAWVTVEYSAPCVTITVRLPPPFSQPLPLVVCH